MLSFESMARLSRASSAAELEVRRLEVAAVGTGGPLGGVVFPSDEQRAASAARATLAALLELRNAAIESGNEAQAAEVAANLERIATPGRVAGYIERPPLPSVPSLVPWWAWALVGLVVLVLLAPYATAAAALAGRRRTA